MAKQTSFAHQKNVLENFSFQLQTFAEDLKSLFEKYGTNISSLYEEQGLMEEIYFDYKNGYIDDLYENINLVITKLQDEHVPFVEKEIDFISSRQ